MIPSPLHKVDINGNESFSNGPACVHSRLTKNKKRLLNQFGCNGSRMFTLKPGCRQFILTGHAFSLAAGDS